MPLFCSSRPWTFSSLFAIGGAKLKLIHGYVAAAATTVHIFVWLYLLSKLRAPTEEPQMMATCHVVLVVVVVLLVVAASLLRRWPRDKPEKVKLWPLCLRRVANFCRKGTDLSVWLAGWLAGLSACAHFICSLSSRAFPFIYIRQVFFLSSPSLCSYPHLAGWLPRFWLEF